MATWIAAHCVGHTGNNAMGQTVDCDALGVVCTVVYLSTLGTDQIRYVFDRITWLCGDMYS